MSGWRTSGRPVHSIPQITVHELKRRLDRGETTLLDVRQPSEWHAGHAADARYLTGAQLPERIGELRDIPSLAVICSSGYRSSVAAACSPTMATPASSMSSAG
jgi:hydroxyacylglutathione hydrolase